MIPEGSYELGAINEFMKHVITRKHLQHTVHDDKKRGITDHDENEDFLIVQITIR